MLAGKLPKVALLGLDRSGRCCLYGFDQAGCLEWLFLYGLGLAASKRQTQGGCQKQSRQLSHQSLFPKNRKGLIL
jgi:hypothetical protein